MGISVPHPPPCFFSQRVKSDTNIELIEDILDKYNKKFDKTVATLGTLSILTLVGIMIAATVVTPEQREWFNWYCAFSCVCFLVFFGTMATITFRAAKKIVDINTVRDALADYSKLFGEEEAREIIKYKFDYKYGL